MNVFVAVRPEAALLKARHRARWAEIGHDNLPTRRGEIRTRCRPRRIGIRVERAVWVEAASDQNEPVGNARRRREQCGIVRLRGAALAGVARGHDDDDACGGCVRDRLHERRRIRPRTAKRKIDHIDVLCARIIDRSGKIGV